MRRGRVVSASTGSGHDFKPVRAATDGKEAKLDYASDAAHQTISTPSGGSGEHKMKTSKWQGRGKRS